ncbi:P-II family nitrogen regulator [Zavarzinia aquatilis]|uniref:Nitrogen regulatory protein P-II n=1 Tax=Zavarzinia aquatilis TaxID=2211142 RepID=A0A317E6G0_9PROT|nr:P-II family nitrogen regulator [Zavarzinia aquatilis]PWR22597.1 P-II family nitrogen regulator [Zavarzinia aquatilis]
MKLIIAVIKSFKLEPVRAALDAIGVHGMTVAEAVGFGRSHGHTEVYRSAEYQIAFVPKLRLDIAVDDEKVAPALEAIERTARTGKLGDGKLFVVELDDAVRIRTGERGSQSI